jgi:CRISPR/Cas system-associated protein Cas10 (large subunit of type III CRISPR-Cas system)
MQYLVKCDISGIQSFIFDVPSDGAARQLKGRSVYVQVLSELALAFFKQRFPQFDLIYNGGGNWYAYFETDETSLDGAIKEFQQEFIKESLFPVLAHVPQSDDFQVDMSAISQKVNHVKLKRPFLSGSYDLSKKLFNWEGFTEDLLNAKGFEVVPTIKITPESPLIKAGMEYKLSQTDTRFNESLLNKLPRTDKGAIDFDTIAKDFSTGDQKLAALKMDVDNLGELFKDRSRQEYEKNSNALSRFFDQDMYQLIKSFIEEKNIYPVFAGGDDCFLIGAWDKVLDVAKEIQEKFDTFQKNELVHKNNSGVTISAGVVIVPPRFPMVRLSEEAEEALHFSKTNGKNKITVFGEPLTWEEFGKAKEIANQLKNMVQEENVSRAILHRIQSSDVGFTSLQERAKNGHLPFPKVHRLKYYLRNLPDKSPNRKSIEELFDTYKRALLNAFLKKDSELNPAVFPVAARWAELLTK